MEAVLRSIAVYAFLLVLLRIAGRRTLGQMTAFDLVLLLIISEATQQALVGQDFSLMNAFLVIATLIGTDIALSLLKGTNDRLSRWIDSAPLVIVQEGKPLMERLKKAHIDESDVLAAARKNQGITAMSGIQWAVLEADGEISIVPFRDGKRETADTGIQL
jgi:uncharacterized membrane protein YcaP (DUF421 family)